MPVLPRVVLHLPLLLLTALGCAHDNAVRVSRADGSTWLESGKTYAGTSVRPQGEEHLRPAEFRLRGKGGQRVTFRLRSQEDALFGRGVELRTSDDAKVEMKNRSLEDGAVTEASAVLPRTDTYRVSVQTGRRLEDRNDYRFELLLEDLPVTELAGVGTYAGEVTDKDRDDLGLYTPVDVYRLEVGSNARRFRVSVTSKDFEPSVWLYTRLGEQATQGGRAELLFTERGEVFLVVGSREDDRNTGRYQLTLEDGRAYEMARMPELALGTTVTGRIAKEYPGNVADYRVRVRTGQVYVVEAKSSDFDVEVMVHNHKPLAQMMGRRDDDGGGGTNARLLAEFPEEGEWVVRVMSTTKRRKNVPEGEGTFTLSFHTEQTAPPPSP